MLGHGFFVGLPELVERPSTADLLEDPSRIDTFARQHRAQRGPIAQVASFVVAEREQRCVDAKELLGEAVADHDPDLTGEEVLLSFGIVPDRRATLFDVRLVEGERNEANLERSTRLEGGHEMLVCITGEGTTVVPGHGETLGGHKDQNPARGSLIPRLEDLGGSSGGVSSGCHAGSTMPAVPEVRPVRPEDVPEVAASLVRAFYDDPSMVYMFPNPRSRERRLRRFFTYHLKRTYLPRGLPYTTEECRSAALWMPPREGPPRMREVFAQLPLLVILGRRAGRALQLVQLVEARHPTAPHYYLAGLGTDPAWQHKGLGSAVMQPVLDLCDREGLPAYLESSKESNIPFYRHHGFDVTGEVSVPDGSLRLWLMWREPLGPPSDHGGA